MRSERWPLLNNVFLGQILFGILLGVTLPSLYASVRAGELRSAAFAGRALVLVFGSLAFGIYLQNMFRHAIVPDYSRLCRFCNGPVNRYSEFCEHCGADLIAPELLVQCPKCKAEVFEGTKHCPECGKRIPANAKRLEQRTPEELEDELDEENRGEVFR